MPITTAWAILPPLLLEDLAINTPTTESPPAPEGAFAVFSEPQFRWLFLGNVAFFFAMQGQMLTRTILAWELTGQATSLAYINLVVAVPLLFASLLGGAITDRVERRQLVVTGQVLILANELFILTLLLLDQLQFWHMLCTAFVAGCAFPFIMPARMAITASVVGPRRMQSAMAFSGAVMNLSRVAGPAVMGIVIAQFSVKAAYVVSSALYVTAILCMLRVATSRSSNANKPRQHLLADIAGGFSYLRQNRPMLICLIFGLLPMFVAMPFQNILVMLAEQAWQRGESGVGTLMAIGGIGGVLGSIWIVKQGESQNRLRLMIGATLAFGLFLGLFSRTPDFTLALLPLLLANTCASAAQTVNNASIQILTDDEMRGRMSSLMMMSFGLTPIGVFPMAIAADRIGAANAITGACILLVVLTALFALSSPTLRLLDQTVKNRLLESHRTG
ncbi:MAG: MFS transporter [Gammaproteobacteria bacterium]|nr:MFS transporter [Pseudomonadales bacterium]MCP5345281.1 MFS transporter [Pseudomonadales bacterium]